MHAQEVAALARDVPTLNLLHERAGLLAGARSAEAPVGKRLAASDDAMRIVAELAESPKAREARQQAEYEARVKADIALHADFFKHRKRQK